MDIDRITEEEVKMSDDADAHVHEWNNVDTYELSALLSECRVFNRMSLNILKEVLRTVEFTPKKGSSVWYVKHLEKRVREYVDLMEKAEGIWR